jgi:hypothetical protein
MLNVVVTIVALSDVVHYRYYGDVLSLADAPAVSQVIDILRSFVHETGSCFSMWW